MQDYVETVTGLTERLRALKGKLNLWKRKMEDSKILSFPRIKHSSGCWISCRKNVVMEHLEEPTLDYDSWNPDEVTKDNCVRRPFDIYIEDPVDGIGRTLDLHEQLMEVLNDDSVPCDFTYNCWFHSGSERNTIKKILPSTGMEVPLPCSITYVYEIVLWEPGGGTRSWSRMQPELLNTRSTLWRPYAVYANSFHMNLHVQCSANVCVFEKLLCGTN